MIDEKLVENIRSYGVYMDNGAGRNRLLAEDLGFRMVQKAEYVILGGCSPPMSMPHVFQALKNLLDRFQIHYSFLSKEYCCGWMPFGQPAVIAKNEGDILKSQELAKNFVMQNFKQAEALGAKAIVLFCAACEPTYSNYKSATRLQVISYSELLNRYFPGGRLSSQGDYYAGCYRFRRRITQTPVDIEPARRLLDKIEGLAVNDLDNNLCCYIRPHMGNLIHSLKTQTVITICTGCYHSLNRALKDKVGYQVRMLPEVVWESVQAG